MSIVLLLGVGILGAWPPGAGQHPAGPFAPGQAARAAGLPSPTPSPELLVAPTPTTIATAPASFSGTGRVTVSGTKLAGSTVSVSAAGSAVCSVQADASTSWSCGRVFLPNGANVELTAIEVAADGSAVPTGSTTVDVLGPPTLDGTGSYTTTGLVSGIGYPGSVIAVSVNAAVDASCGAVPVQGSGYWSCALAQRSGTVVVRAQQSNTGIGSGALSAFSNIQTVTIDRQPPASAVITSPAAEARVERLPVSVSGTGEDAATIDLYVDNGPVCSTVVAGGVWACTLDAISNGPHSLQAIQRDAAGNYAVPSPAFRVLFGPRAAGSPSATPTPVPTPAPTPAPGDSAPEPTESPSDQPVPTPGGGSTPGPTGAQGGVSSPPSTWGTPSGFGESLLAGASVASTNWYTGPLIGLFFVMLVALPLRLLADALRGRVRMPRTTLTGRNRDRREAITLRGTLADRDTPLNPWVTRAVPFVICAILAVLAGGVSGEVRYLRLFLAVLLGLSILTLVGAAITTRLTARAFGLQTRLRFLPLMLLAAFATALISRFSDLHPPLVAGVLIGAAFAAGTPVRQRAIVNLAQVGAVTVLGVGGWMLHGLLGATEGFWSSVLSETLATLCLAGLGSAMVLMLPLASLPGRVILEWSPPVWAGTVLLVASVTAAAVFGRAEATADLLPWLIGAAVFATLSVAAWAFVRFVEPQVQHR